MFSKLLLFTHSAQKFLFKLCCYFAIQLYLIFLQFLMGNVEVLYFWAGKRVILSLYWSVSWGLLKWKFLLTFVLFNYLRKIIWLGVLVTWVKFYSLYTREETGMLFLLKCTIYMCIYIYCTYVIRAESMLVETVMSVKEFWLTIPVCWPEEEKAYLDLNCQLPFFLD